MWKIGNLVFLRHHINYMDSNSILFTCDWMLWYSWQLPSGRVSFHQFLKKRDAFDGIFGKKITQTPPDYDIRQKTSNSTWSLITLQVDRYWWVIWGVETILYEIHFESSYQSRLTLWNSSGCAAFAKRRKVHLCSTYDVLESVYPSCIFIIIMVSVKYHILNHIDRFFGW